jgi:hypothetical protein
MVKYDFFYQFMTNYGELIPKLSLKENKRVERNLQKWQQSLL